MDITDALIDRLTRFVGHLRPLDADDVAEAEAKVLAEADLLCRQPDDAALLRTDLEAILCLPRQVEFFAETGVHSASGFWAELTERIGRAILPPVPDNRSLRNILTRVFCEPGDHTWIVEVSDDAWLALAEAIGLFKPGVVAEALATPDATEVTKPSIAFAALTPMQESMIASVRVLSYRLAGSGLDRELLRADPALERHESPFVAQCETLTVLIDAARTHGGQISGEDIRHVEVLLDQCLAAVARVRKQSGTSGISVRLTYLLARLQQLTARMRLLSGLLRDEDQRLGSVQCMKLLLGAELRRHRVTGFLADNLSLLARNVTDQASQHGEHYIAEDRAAWRDMLRSAAGGGVIIAVMALIKIRLAMLHLPPLTEGLAFGLNYALGFVLIHLLGFVVATKQPAMTAAAIAAALEEANPKKLEPIVDLARNVVRTQFIAVVGNVGMAVPVASVLALLWWGIAGTPPAPETKLLGMLNEVHPWRSGALFFAAIAAVGLFMSGLVSGYFDNQALYHRLPQRIAAMRWLNSLSPVRRQALAGYLERHYGAILGNLFFGFYLGLIGAGNLLSGLPLEIRHVAFSAANLGTAFTSLEWGSIKAALPMAVIGVAGIALVNLWVSFALALHVAMSSRQLNTGHFFALGRLLLTRALRDPLSFLRPPR